MKAKKKTIKVKKSLRDALIEEKRAFLWRVIDEKEISEKKVKITFERGRDEVTTKKGIKKVKKYEKMYRQIKGKRAPVAAIIQTAIFGGIFACYFFLKEPVIQVAIIIASSITGAITIFVWLAYLLTMIKKKKLIKWLKDECKKYDTNPNEEAIKQEVESIEEIVEPYIQGEEK